MGLEQISLSGSRENELPALLDQLIQQVREGREPLLEGVCQAHPEFASRLRELLPTLIAMERLKPQRVDSAQALGPRSQIGDYTILREIGRGGMGVVYEALQRSLGRHVALKVISNRLSSDSAAIMRFRREATAAARLHHTNIVSVFEIGQDGDLCFYSMQFIQGRGIDQVICEIRSLRERLQSKPFSGNMPSDQDLSALTARSLMGDQDGSDIGGTKHDVSSSAKNSDLLVQSEHADEQAGLGPSNRRGGIGRDSSTSSSGAIGMHYFRNVARIGLQIAETLQFAHDKGVVHRDIKPSNILIDVSGAAWITDFGLAQFGDINDDDGTWEEVTHTGDIVGTVRYMAPERLRGVHDFRGDIYGLGMTLYELLALRPAFAASDRVQLLEQIATAEPVALRRIDPRVPRDLETIIGKAIAKEPPYRYHAAQLMADDLRLFLQDRPIRARRSSGWERSLRWCRRNPVVTSLAAIILLLATALGIGAPIMNIVSRERDRAVANLDRAERAEREVKVRSHLSQARLHRLSGRTGQRFECLRELVEAEQLDPSPDLRRELRDEAIAALGLTDLRVRIDRPVGKLFGSQCDFQLRRYAFVDFLKTYDVVVRQLEDDRELLRAPRPEFSFWHATTDFTPDGTYLLICYFPRQAQVKGDAILHVWHLERRELVHTHEIRSGDVIGAIAARDDRLYFVDRQVKLCVWNLATGRTEKTIPLGMVPYSICIDSEGRRVAVNDYRVPLVRILDLETEDEIASWRTNVGRYAMAWSADGQLLASADIGDQIFVRHVPDGELVSILEGPPIRAAFAHRGNMLATSSWDGTTQLWNAMTGERLIQAVGEMLRFSDDDTRLGFVHSKGLGIWDVAHDIESRTIQSTMALGARRNQRCMFGASFEPTLGESGLVATYEISGVGLWDRASGRELAHLDCGLTKQVLFRTDGSGFLTLSSVDGLYYWPMRREHADDLDLLQIGPPRLLQALDSSEFMAAALLPDNRGVVVADNINRRVIVTSMDSTQSMDKAPITLPSQHGRIMSLAVSADGRWVAAGGWKEWGVQIWNLAEKRLECVLPHSDSNLATVFFVDFSPNNRWLVVSSSSDDSCSYLTYRVGTWEQAMRQSAQFGTRVHSAFSKDGRLMSTSQSPAEVLINDAANGRELMHLPTYYQNGWPTAFSDDGNELIVASGGYPAIWWNLFRLNNQLRELGLAWDFTLADGGGALAAPFRSEDKRTGNHEPNVQDDSELWSSSRRTALDVWSNNMMTPVLKVHVDQGDLPQRIAAQEGALNFDKEIRFADIFMQSENWLEVRSARRAH